MLNQRKQSILLPQLTPVGKSLCLELHRDNQIIKPKLQRIVAQQISVSSRMLANATILQSMLNKRSFEDVREQLKEKEIQRLLRETKTGERQQKLKGRVGKEAQFKFYENYKKLDKLLCKKKITRSTILQPLDNDPTLCMLEVAQNLRVLPCCMGFIKNNGDSNELNLKGQKFGDKYIAAISAGIREAKIIQNCQFSNNRLTDQGLKSIANNLSPEIVKIDLSHNKISKIASALLTLIVEPEARLQYINLENNLISDKSAEFLFRTARSSKHLKYLNVRKNLLTKNCSQSLTQLISGNTSLEQLYIGMNRINEEASLSVLDALEDNKTIKVFDYCMSKLGDWNSNNNLGNSCKIAKVLAKVLLSNKVLVHVDFSSNNFNEEQSKIIAEGLSKNKKIYGFHFSGNFGYVDSKGFLKMENKNITSLHSIMHKNINGYDIVFRREATSLDPSKFSNVCWICQGWYEQLFKFIIPQPREDGKNHVYIHFDFEEFQPRLINISDVKVRYKTMVPPRRYRYFYTWNNIQFIDIFPVGTSKSLGEKVSTHSQSTTQKMEIPLNFTYQMNNEKVNFAVTELSCKTGKPKKIVNCYDQIIVKVLPRQDGLVSKKQKKLWSYKNSVWAKEWKLEDEQLTKNCFEKDWKCSKLTNLVKNQTEQDKIKQLLYKNYKLIKQLYRHYSSWSPFNSDIWAVSNNAFTQFCHIAKIISKDAPLTIIDLTFITTNSISGTDYKGNSLVPERGLVRFQFMQGIVRLSEQKFKKNGLADSILDSLTNMMKDHIQPLSEIPLCNSQKWRLSEYFCEHNDILLKKYRPIFTQIYKKNSKMKVKPGNKPFMCLAQFKSIIQRIGVAGTYVLERDIFLSFNCSMMTQIDQLENQRFIRMSQIEFIEAVSRCAYILPQNCKMEDIFGEKTPFHAKFEWIIHQLKMLCSQDIKNMFSETVSLFNKLEDD